MWALSSTVSFLYSYCKIFSCSVGKTAVGSKKNILLFSCYCVLSNQIKYSFFFFLSKHNSYVIQGDDSYIHVS